MERINININISDISDPEIRKIVTDYLKAKTDRLKMMAKRKMEEE